MADKFPKYNLTDKQIRGIACIVAHEQGTLEGMMAEASQICNRTDIKGDKYATPENLVKTVCSGWYAHGKERYNKGTSNALAIKAVKLCAVMGLRILPRYIDEHDCMSDISTVKNGLTSVKYNKSKWIPHKTIIRNKMSSKYTFYSFPGGYKTNVDPFGYTSKDMRKKWGDFCYTFKEALAGGKKETTPKGLLKCLDEYHKYIKKNYKKFYNHYDGDMTTFEKAKSAVNKGKKVGLTCVVPLRWALYELGIKGESKYLISAPEGSFKSYFNGQVPKYFKRITSGSPIGMTVVEACKKGLLKPGDIVAYKGHTHTSVYKNKTYFYEGGGSCVVNGHYPKGILLDYSKNFYKDAKISEILRWKTSEPKQEEKKETKKETQKPVTTKKGNYIGNIPKLPKTRSYYKLGDGYETMSTHNGDVKNIQKALNWAINAGLKIDGCYGKNTRKWVIKYQKIYGLKADGFWGSKCNAKLQTITR